MKNFKNTSEKETEVNAELEKEQPEVLKVEQGKGQAEVPKKELSKGQTGVLKKELIKGGVSRQARRQIERKKEKFQVRLQLGKVYAEMFCDFMFKRLFGSEANKDVLIEFLNMILEDIDIKDVTFIPTEHHGLTEEDRKAVFDISCECKDGSIFIIEMQTGYQKHFRERALYYTSFPINEQGRLAREEFIRDNPGQEMSGFKWNYNLKPVIVVAIIDFLFPHAKEWPDDRYHSSYRLKEDLTGEPMTDALRFVFLELGRFNKNIWELETFFDKWVYLMKHMHEMVEIPEVFNEPFFQRLFFLAKIGNFTPEEHSEYIKSIKRMGDYQNIIQTTEELAEKRGIDKGIEIGIEKGIEKGRTERDAEIALKLKEMGMSTEDIAKATGLSEEAILGL